MEKYDPNKRYLGPQGHWLTKWIPECPRNAPDELKELWNQAAYDHDEDFHGDEFAGFMGWLKKWINKTKVKKEISESNQKFRDKLTLAVVKTKHLMTPLDTTLAFEYANIVFNAVEQFGWAFYKTGGEDA